MRERIRPPKDLEVTVLERLKGKIFETKQKGMMFAAAIGFAMFRDQLASTVIDHYGEGIRMEYFRSPQDDGFIDAISVALSNDLAILAPEKQEERIDTFERLTYLGLQEIQKQCFDSRIEDPLLGILSIVDRMQKPTMEKLPGLERVSEELGEYF